MELPRGEMNVRLTRTKNKQPAEVQITAEQLIREALANQIDDIRPPRVQINDQEELDDYIQRKRAEFENTIRKQRYYVNGWVKYTDFEESLNEIKRARNVFIRALEVDYTNPTLWIKFAEMEMRNKMLNNARNVWEKAVYLLPRTDQLWYKYAFMEEMLANYNGARRIFERWININPPMTCWVLYSKFEERMGERQKSREILYEMIYAHPDTTSYLKVAKYEEKRKRHRDARKAYERGIEELGPHANSEEFFLNFIQFEIRMKELERARVLFKHGLELMSREKAPNLYQEYVNFEKQYGSRLNIEIVVLNKRRALYEKQLAEDPMEYDTWFDYVSLEENEGNVLRVRETYERAVANTPCSKEKKHWRRYIYLWLSYAVFEETQGEVHRTREIYEEAVKRVPHKHFSFSKLWVLYAHFEVRQLDLNKARKVFGTGIGLCGSNRVFEAYIELELQLGNIDRCRKINEKWIETDPSNSLAWVKYSELEYSLEELERTRYILESAINQPTLSTPEIVWKTYIDREIELTEYDRVCNLYERLLDKTKHLKVWTSYAQFLYEYISITTARETLKKGDLFFKHSDERESRFLLLQFWEQIEETAGTGEELEAVRQKMPKLVKKKKKISDFGEDEGWEEYLDYIFPDEGNYNLASKILEKAKGWKLQQKQEN